MASEKTTELQLNIWKPTDNVSMTEFNENFQKIDRGIIATGQKIDNEIQQVTTQLAQKAVKQEVRENTTTRPIDVSEMNTATKQLFTGGAVAVVGENSVGSENIKEKGVKDYHIGFLKQSKKNLFSGKFYDGVLWHHTPPDRLYPRKNFNGSQGKIAIVPVTGGKKYIITLPDNNNDRFRVGASSVMPIFTDKTEIIPLDSEVPLERFLIRNDDIRLRHTVTIPADMNYLLIFVSNSGIEPRLQVEEGTKESTYENPKLVPLDVLDYYQTNNINTSNFLSGMALNTLGLIIADTGTVSIFLEIEGGKVYYVRKIDVSNRFRIGLSATISSPTVSEYMRPYYVQDTADMVRVQTEPTDKYMMIYLSNINEKPRVNVTEGEDYPYYKNPKTLDKDLEKAIDVLASKNAEIKEKAETALELVESQITRRKFFVVGTPSLYVSNNYVDPTSKKTADVLAIYETIENSPLVTKSILGRDGLNNPIYEYVIDKPLPHITNNVDYEPTKISYDRREKIKILINSGTHGDEKGAAYGLALFIKDLVENKESPALKFIRDNVTFKIIPVLNPSGYDAHTRPNHNVVDINRDYIAKTQLETKIVTAWVDANLDAVACLDYHNSARTVSFWPATDQQIYHELFYSVINWVNDYWQEFNPAIKNPVGELVLTDLNVNLNSYAHSRGMFGITVEAGRHSNTMNGGSNSNFDAVAIKYGNELLVNTIITIMRYFT